MSFFLSRLEVLLFVCIACTCSIASNSCSRVLDLGAGLGDGSAAGPSPPSEPHQTSRRSAPGSMEIALNIPANTRKHTQTHANTSKHTTRSALTLSPQTRILCILPLEGPHQWWCCRTSRHDEEPICTSLLPCPQSGNDTCMHPCLHVSQPGNLTCMQPCVHAPKTTFVPSCGGHDKETPSPELCMPLNLLCVAALVLLYAMNKLAASYSPPGKALSEETAQSHELSLIHI